MYKVPIVIVSLLFLANYARAWVEPKAGDDIPAPINTSSQEQTKLGIFNVSNWIKVLTSPFNFNIGVQAPKFCIQKPDGTTSCCPPAAGQDWSACAVNNGGGGLNAKWVFNNFHSPTADTSSYDLISVAPDGVQTYLNNSCYCYTNTNSKPYAILRAGYTSCAEACSIPSAPSQTCPSNCSSYDKQCQQILMLLRLNCIMSCDYYKNHPCCAGLVRGLPGLGGCP